MKKELQSRSIGDLLDNLSSDNATLKFQSAKVLNERSKSNPKEVYPHFDSFAELLSSSNNILKWNAIRVISNLVAVDKEKKFDKLFDRYYALLDDQSMITAASLIDSSATIVSARPNLEDKILDRILGINKTHHGGECKNILIGKVILFLSGTEKLYTDKRVVNFVKQALTNSRHATKVKAEKYYAKLKKVLPNI